MPALFSSLRRCSIYAGLGPAGSGALGHRQAATLVAPRPTSSACLPLEIHRVLYCRIEMDLLLFSSTHATMSLQHSLSRPQLRLMSERPSRRSAANKQCRIDALTPSSPPRSSFSNFIRNAQHFHSSQSLEGPKCLRYLRLLLPQLEGSW